MTRDQLLAYSFTYEGETIRIKQAIMRNESYEPISGVFSAITILDDTYPDCLRTLRDPPYVLYYKGDLNLLRKEAIAVVGSRTMLSYAEAMTKALIGKLAQHYVIVSGLAKGIDACAHSQGLQGVSTIAVLGCGINRIYPFENKALYLQIENQGLILSEYPDHAQPLKHRFPWRNRIVAALGKALVVMQADYKSGSMITVNEALDLGKEIYTIPYDLMRPEGQGCNLLIQQGANMILSDEDLMSI
jgi:DNA processing protein